MTRRKAAFAFAAAASNATGASRQTISVPVRILLDSRTAWTPARKAEWSSLWQEASDDFAAACSVRLSAVSEMGEIRLSASGKPIFVGLAQGSLNVMVTRRLPGEWDRGRGVAGITTLWEGFHLCAIGLDHAYRHRIPFVAINTCVHELLHAFLLDIFERRPPGWEGSARELRIDAYGTRLWLFRDGSAVRESVAAYLKRLLAKSQG